MTSPGAASASSSSTVWPARLSSNGTVAAAPGCDAEPLPDLAVLLQGHGDRLARCRGRQLLDAQRQLLWLADHGVVGHLVDHEAAVPLARLAGEQQVQGRIDAQALEARRHVVHLAVRQDHHAREARAVDLGQAARERSNSRVPPLPPSTVVSTTSRSSRPSELGAQLLEGGLESAPAAH